MPIGQEGPGKIGKLDETYKDEQIVFCPVNRTSNGMPFAAFWCRNLTRSGDVSDIPRLNPCLGDVFINITVAEGGLANNTQSGITQRTGFVNYRDELVRGIASL